MKKLLYIIPALILAACATDMTGGEPTQNPTTGVELTSVEAVIDSTEESRNSLVDEPGKRFILWSEDDAIGINGVVSGSNIQGSLDEDSVGKQNAMFWYAQEFLEGGIAYAYYPYSSNSKIVNGKLTASLTANQEYMTESVFAPNVTIMVGKPDANGVLKFVNSCSIIEIRLKGTQLLSALALRSIATPIAGTGTVMLDDAEPKFVLNGTDDKYEISLNLGEGVQLNADEATSFYFVIPAGTYSDLQVVATFEGGEVVRDLTKVHTIAPRHILPTSAFTVQPLQADECTALGGGELSNCYMIPATQRGKHSFVAKHVNGNAINGTPVMAAVLWSDEPNIVGNVHYDAESGKVLFTTNDSGINGNALISLFDADMNILWSWHIWVTDAEDQVLGQAQDVTLLDRNLGAKYAPKSAEDVAAMDAYKAASTAGLYYQWGRNTPFPGPMTLDSYYATKDYSIQNKWGYEAKAFSANTAKTYINKNLGKTYKFENKHFTDASQTIAAAAATPMAMIHGDVAPYIHTWASDLSKVNVGGSEDLWSTNGKGNQDPCPAGYRVAGFTELLHAYRDYKGTGSSYYKYLHFCVGAQAVGTTVDNYGGYYTGEGSNNLFVWLPQAGVRISYMRTDKKDLDGDGEKETDVPCVPSARSEQGTMYKAGFFAYDSAATLTCGNFYMCGVPDKAWTPHTGLATTGSNKTHFGSVDGVYVPTMYMTTSGNPYEYKSGSNSYCHPVADAVPVRCVKMQ